MTIACNIIKYINIFILHKKFSLMKKNIKQIFKIVQLRLKKANSRIMLIDL